MSTSLERIEYGFDRDSRRTWRRRMLATGEDNAYGYDGLSQVVNAARGNLNLNASAIAAVPVAAESWDYDPTGNWQGYHYATTGTGAVTLDQSRVHDQGNRLTQVVGDPNPVTLDRAGRMLEVPPGATGDWSKSLLVKWDAWNRIVEITNADGSGVAGSYAYDGLTRRITRTVGSTTTQTYYSDAWRPLEERTGSSTTPTLQYYWGARHRDDLVRRDSSTGGGTLNTTRYVLMDYFSPAALTDETGAIKERYAFSAFGVRRILSPTFTPVSTSECGFEFAFQGQFQDTESGLLNYGFRYYSPALGRWLCKDPLQEKAGWNLYGMVGNKPTLLVDFIGLSPSYWDVGYKAALDAYNASMSAPQTRMGSTPEFCGLICCCDDGRNCATPPHKGSIDIDPIAHTERGTCEPTRDADGSTVRCPSNCNFAGTYHSHPSGDPTPSENDWNGPRRTGQFIGGSQQGGVTHHIIGLPDSTRKLPPLTKAPTGTYCK